MKKNYILFAIIIIIAIVGYFSFLFFNKPARIKSEQDNNQADQSPAVNNDIKNMKIEVLKEGTGTEAKNGDYVTVHYVGTFENGEKFDSSVDRGVPFPFTLGAGQVIKGWDLGVLNMKVGEKRRLTIPSDLAYGDSGSFDGAIPPKATLIFEVELLKIN